MLFGLLVFNLCNYSVPLIKDPVSFNIFAPCLTGRVWEDGRVMIGLCDFIEPWDNLSMSQKKSLNHRYEMGCDCRVSAFPLTAAVAATVARYMYNV